MDKAQLYYLLAAACAENGDGPAAWAAAKRAVMLSAGEKRYGELLRQLEEAR